MANAGATNGNGERRKWNPSERILAGALVASIALFALMVLDLSLGINVLQRIFFTPEKIAAQEARRVEVDFIYRVEARNKSLVCPDPVLWATLSKQDQERWHRYWRNAQWGSEHSWCGKPTCDISYGSELFQGTDNCYVPRKSPDKQQ